MRKIALILMICLILPCAAFAADIKMIGKSDLASLVEKSQGKVVMLNFFATWCPPCRTEIPELVKLRSAIPESKLTLIGLSVDEDATPVAPFIERLGVNYPVYLAGKEITDAFNLKSVPHNTFFAPDSQIVISEPGLVDLDDLKRLVNDLYARK